MAGGVVVSAITEEGFPYFVQEVKSRVNFFKLRDKFLPQISQWIAAANALMYEDISGANTVRSYGKLAGNTLSDQQRLRKSVFMGYYESSDRALDYTTTRNGKTWVMAARNAVTSSGEGSVSGSGATLEAQWHNVVQHNQSTRYNYSSNIYNEKFFRQYDVLKQGYRILTQIGEAIRGDEVTYKIVMRNSGGFGYGAFGDTWEYTADLKKYLKYAGTSNSQNIFRSELKLTNSDMQLRENLDSRRWNYAEQNAIDLFISQVRGYIEWHGGGFGPASSKMAYARHPYASANKGQILEAYLQSGYTARYLQRGNESDWRGLIGDYMKMAMGLGENSFSAFWQGGEGGTNLATTQVKGRYASITSMKTLVRQMTRIYSFMNGFTPEKFVDEAKSNFLGSGKFGDDKIIEEIIKMFYSQDFLKSYQITIPV